MFKVRKVSDGVMEIGILMGLMLFKEGMVLVRDIYTEEYCYCAAW